MTGIPEPISPEARRALEQELADLRAERDAVAATLQGNDADSPGDQADQADELQRAGEAARLDAGIAEITSRLSEAAVAAAPRQDVIGVGSSFTVSFADGTRESFQLGELANELDQGLLTADSPLGHALLGHRAGDSVSYDTPVGRASAVVESVGDPPSSG
ncbi:GreA/GreB family elongation factor [Kitasatospora sp. NBC_01287]|uniref:GreA/GreB family elongation factor n=1 Tax=Kitasatospora sp. NBC_01287 TaxID=2903573 RepID=UPI00224EEAE9|nr:GreA/GreB family elongation factor [Kitasatospora sp. NBC_01287]MCX4750853.1 GreA/GreB family elongation factor [Kitasatospora sp. NBC_01287]